MDCPSEENLIRMKLDGISSIANLRVRIRFNHVRGYRERLAVARGRRGEGVRGARDV